MHFLQASIFNFDHLDILRDPMENPSQYLLSFEFAQSFCIQFRASRYITRLNRTSEEKVIVIWICSKLLFSISSIMIYDGTQSDIRVKTYCRLNFLRVSIFNFVSHDILHDSIGLSSKNLLSFEFSQSFCFQFRAPRIIKGLNWTSESKVIVLWICSELLFSILSISNY